MKIKTMIFLLMACCGIFQACKKDSHDDNGSPADGNACNLSRISFSPAYPLSKVEYEYNSDNQVVKEMEYNTSAALSQHSIYEYRNGKLFLFSIFDKDNNLVSYNTYHYGSNAKIDTEYSYIVDYLKNSSLTSKTAFRYNADSTLAGYDFYSFDSGSFSFYGSTACTLNNRGNVTKTLYYDKNRELEKTVNSLYDERPNILKSTNPPMSFIQISANNCIKQTAVDSSGNVLYEQDISYEYGADGRAKKETAGQNVSTFDYTCR
jgi:hypothetical protein